MYKKSNFKKQESTPNDTSWNNVAKWYDTFVGDVGGKFHQDLIVPLVDEMLALKPDLSILDLGCGQGFYSRHLVSLNKQLNIVGIDKSSELIKIAKQRGDKGIKYLSADATNLEVIKDMGFDRIICILAIQNMDPLEKVFSWCNRLLNKGGQLVIVTTHPAFRIPRQSGWGIDEGRKLQYRRVDSYMSVMKIPIIAHPGQQNKIATWTFHRPLEKYVEELSTHGFVIDKLKEVISNKKSEKGKFSKAEDTARLEIPMFIAIRALKI